MRYVWIVFIQALMAKLSPTGDSLRAWHARTDEPAIFNNWNSTCEQKRPNPVGGILPHRRRTHCVHRHRLQSVIRQRQNRRDAADLDPAPGRCP